MAPDEITPGTGGGSSGMPDMGAATAKLKGATGADRMILVAGLAYFVASFLPWYGVGIAGIGSYNASGWNSGGLAMLAILCGIALTLFAAARVIGMNNPMGGLQDGMIYLVLGIATFAFTLLRFLTQMNFVKFGLYLAIILSAVMAYGAWMKNQGRS